MLFCINGCSSSSRSAVKPNIVFILAASLPEKAGKMLGLLKKWRGEVGADMPALNPDFDPARRWEWGPHPGIQATLRGEKAK